MIIIIITLKNTHNLFIIIIQIQLQSMCFYLIPNKTQGRNLAWRLQSQILVVILLLPWPFSWSPNRTQLEKLIVKKISDMGLFLLLFMLLLFPWNRSWSRNPSHFLCRWVLQVHGWIRVLLRRLCRRERTVFSVFRRVLQRKREGKVQFLVMIMLDLSTFFC